MALAALAGVGVSMKMSASPGAIEVTPLSATALAMECELSSIFQPLRTRFPGPL
jgi:hypothetical protein